MADSSAGRVFLVGAGPGDPGLLTLRAAQAIAQADVLLYDALAAPPIVELAPPSCERIFVGKRGGNHAMEQRAIETLAIERARAGKRVVRLKGGDPFVFGRGGEEAQALAEAGIAFEIVPGISSAIAAPAYAGIPVTHREHNTAFTVATGHEDPLKPLSTLDWQRLADPHRTLVLLMATANLREIARLLCDNGLPATTPAAAIENGTRPEQRTVVGTLATIADDVERSGVGAPAVLVIGSVVALRDEIAWFDRRPLFGKTVLVTRPAAQAADFARALLARGAQPLVAPLIAIAPPADPAAAHDAVDRLSSFDWVVFTSCNGVDALFARLGELGADARRFGGAKIAAIGSATAARLLEGGLRADLVPGDFVGEALAQAMVEAVPRGSRVLIYRAQEARDVLPRALEQAGISVTIAAAYRTVAFQDPEFASKVARADAIALASPSTVSAFVNALGGAGAAIEATRDKLLAAIGPVTESAIEEAGLRTGVTARTYTGDGLIEALEAHYAAGACS